MDKSPRLAKSRWVHFQVATQWRWQSGLRLGPCLCSQCIPSHSCALRIQTGNVQCHSLRCHPRWVAPPMPNVGGLHDRLGLASAALALLPRLAPYILGWRLPAAPPQQVIAGLLKPSEQACFFKLLELLLPFERLWVRDRLGPLLGSVLHPQAIGDRVLSSVRVGHPQAWCTGGRTLRVATSLACHRPPALNLQQPSRLVPVWLGSLAALFVHRPALVG